MTEELCEDEGCPNFGTPHVCIDRRQMKVKYAVEHEIDIAPLHDVLVDIKDQEYTQDQVAQYFWMLPRSIRLEAMTWGFDTVVRENALEFLKDKVK